MSTLNRIYNAFHSETFDFLCDLNISIKENTVVFCSFRIEVYTLQISGKELFVYVKFKKKKLILRFQQRYHFFDSIFSQLRTLI